MDSEAILEFTVKVNVKPSEDTQKFLNDLQDAKSGQSPHAETKQDTQEAKDNPNETIEEKLQKKLDKSLQDKQKQKTQKQKDDELKSDVVKTLNKLDSKGLQTLSNFATNPTGSTLNALTSVVSMAGPEGAALIALISLAISAPAVIKKIVDVLSVKGGPLNRDYITNLVTKQVEVGITRVQQKRLEQGEDQLILSQVKGFTPNNSDWAYNSYLKMNDTRASRIGLTDRSFGVTTA